MTKKFAIGIPTLNRLDLLLPALHFYAEHDFKNVKIFVVDNGDQKISHNYPNVKVLVQERNIGVAASWNLLCDKIFEEHEYALILNDDIYLGKNEQQINFLLQQYKTDLATSIEDFCCFVLSKDCFSKVGRFDEEFYPAYYEDNDYAYRAKLKGFRVWPIPFLIPSIYRNSQTLEKAIQISQYVAINKQRYIDKWGGEPSKETFKKPFNK